MAWGQGPSTIIAPLVVVLAHWYASQSGLACISYETAFVGDDLNLGVGDAESMEECQEACQKNADCAHWTYDGGQRQCHLKRDGAQIQAVSSPLAVSGPRYCTLPSQCVSYGVEFKSSSDVDRIEDGSVPNAEACRSLCAQNLQCTFWTYFPTSKNCYLKGQGTEFNHQQPNAAAISGPKNCPPPATLSCFQAHMDYVWDSRRGDPVYHQGVGSAKECQKLCQLEPACHVFTYVETSNLCALGKTTPYPVYRLGATTGPKYCIPPASTGENIEILGKDLATHRTPSYVACQLLCESSPLCSAATYNTESGTCVHKQTARFDEEVTSGPKLCRWLGPFPQSYRGQLPGHTAAAEPAINSSEIGVGAAPGAPTEVHVARPTLLSEGESLCTLHRARRHYTYKRQQHMYSLQKVPDELRQPQSAGSSTPQADHAGEGCFHKGVEILGRDVGTGVAEGPAECQRMCRANELCSVFAYYTSSMLCVQRQRARWMAGLVSFEKHVKRRGAAGVEPLFQENTNTSVLPVEDKCFSSGFQIEDVVLVSTREAGSAEGCQMLCQKEPLCSQFTYFKNDQRCCLLQSGGRKVPKKNSLCGPKFCDLEAHTKVAREDLAPCFLTGYFYDGLTLTHIGGVVSAEACQRYCQRKPWCTAFSYFQKKQLCRLHVDSGDPADDPDAVAGLRACPSLSERTFDGKAGSSWEARSSTLQENVVSAESCREACAVKPSCDVFTYSTRQRRCLLHSGHRIVEAEESWTAGSSKRENSEEACVGDGQHNECAVYAYKSGLTSRQECQKLCETDPSCQYSTFYEKDGVRSRPQQGGKPSDDSVLFEPQFIVTQGRRQVENCLLAGTCSPEDVPAVAFSDYVSSAQECERLCEDNPLCSVFTYATLQRTCKLHPKDLHTENDTTAVPRMPLAGFSLENEQGDCFLHGFYYDGMALSSRMGVKFAKECQWLCQVEPLCKFFSYFIREQMCGLLSEPGNKVEEMDAVCGPRICPLKHWEAR